MNLSRGARIQTQTHQVSEMTSLMCEFVWIHVTLSVCACLSVYACVISRFGMYVLFIPFSWHSTLNNRKIYLNEVYKNRKYTRTTAKKDM